MERDEGTTPDTIKCKEDTIRVLFDDISKININSIRDRVMLQILEDSARENDEPLRLIETKIWNPDTKIAEFDVNDSTVLELMFGKAPKR